MFMTRCRIMLAASLAALPVVCGGCIWPVSAPSETSRTPPPVSSSLSSLELGEHGHQLVVEFSNTTAGDLSYSLEASAAWVQLSSKGGSLAAGARQTIYVTVDHCDLTWKPGVQEAEVRVLVGGQVVQSIPVRVMHAARAASAVIAAQLAGLPPLPKVHYSYATDAEVLDNPASGLLYEWVRITHNVTLELIGADAAKVRNAIAVVQAVNSTGPAIPARLSLKYSPWEYVFPANQPPMYAGPEVQAELDQMSRLLTQVDGYIDAANAALGTAVAVDSIILNTEVWRARQSTAADAAVWNAALKEKYDAAYNLCKAVFPGALVHWYNRGKPLDRGGYFALNELGDSCSQELYFVHDLPALRYRYRLGYQFSQTIGQTPIAWINLNGAFSDDLPDGQLRYLCGIEYPIENAWQLGLELNWPGFDPPADQQPPLKVAPAVTIYPAAFVSTEPDFARYFVAYVQGAANIPLTP